MVSWTPNSHILLLLLFSLVLVRKSIFLPADCRRYYPIWWGSWHSRCASWVIRGLVRELVIRLLIKNQRHVCSTLHCFYCEPKKIRLVFGGTVGSAGCSPCLKNRSFCSHYKQKPRNVYFKSSSFSICQTTCCFSHQTENPLFVGGHVA